MLSRPRWAPRPWRSMEEARIWLSSMRCDSIPMGGHSEDTPQGVACGSFPPSTQLRAEDPRALSPHMRGGGVVRAAPPRLCSLPRPRPSPDNRLRTPAPEGTAHRTSRDSHPGSSHPSLTHSGVCTPACALGLGPGRAPPGPFPPCPENLGAGKGSGGLDRWQEVQIEDPHAPLGGCVPQAPHAHPVPTLLGPTH